MKALHLNVTGIGRGAVLLEKRTPLGDVFPLPVNL
jgi:hypothetical protein